ncbi:hypothetical protein [Xylanimonas protaetiae]|uniref:Phage portal protein n=1 Tax=Xylanimonas protaetiae TaxID=2509457 RepID=A0A4P6F6P3_9MICO|nr:hypothetical protein [Xylanimonas protaetiae]QAY69999.1 hypothetical protein ET471_08115 [Xylanimonas protaetiae]
MGLVNTVRRTLRLTESASTSTALVRATAAEANIELLSEAIAELELSLEDQGWERLTAQAVDQFSREGLQRAVVVSRTMAVIDPLISAGLTLRHAYIWGQGVNVQARAQGGDDGEQDVNAVVQAFWDDPGTRRSLSGDQAHEILEKAAGTDGNVFHLLFTNPRTGKVQPRTIPFDEVTDILYDPQDRATPWYYRRQWVQQTLQAGGTTKWQTQVAWYPAVGYMPRPADRMRTINGAPVMWDAPIVHTKVNAQQGWDFGVGDVYPALRFARLYKDFLVDWATLVKALSQFAFRMTAKSKGRAQQARQALARRPQAHIPGNENSVGATAVMTEDQTLEAIPKTGATIDSESGRPLASMVASALGLPVTMLLGDPGATGARATAETLDEPTRLRLVARQSVWTETIRTIVQYVILQAVKAPQGPLRGRVERDDQTGYESVILDGDTDATVEIDWPSLEKTPLNAIVEAIAKADDTGKLPPLVIVKLLLQALGVKDADEILDDLTDEDGNWVDPYREVGAQVGQAAVNAFRRGQDPTAMTARTEPPTAADHTEQNA